MKNKNEKRAALLKEISEYAAKMAELVATFNKLGFDDPQFPCAYINEARIAVNAYEAHPEIFTRACGDIVDFKNYSGFANGRFPENPTERSAMMGQTRVFEIGNFKKEIKNEAV